MGRLSDYLVEPGWKRALRDVLADPAFQAFETDLIRRVRDGETIYPAMKDLFTAFNLTPMNTVRIVILGQDPYHGEGQAMGLSFSVPEGVKLPPSLHNIMKEIERDIGAVALTSGDLTGWARQGVLLLNTALTVKAGEAGSHAGLGWEPLTDQAIASLSEERAGIVFMLWGSHAQKKAALIDERRHLLLCGPHPSPLSAYRGFFGCGHFSKANAYLGAQGLDSVIW